MQKAGIILCGLLLLISVNGWLKKQAKYQEVCDELSNKNIVVTVIGEAVSYQGPVWVFERATIERSTGRVWSGVRVVLRAGPFRPNSSLSYRYRGTLTCSTLRKNPTAKADGTRYFFRPQVFASGSDLEALPPAQTSLRLYLREAMAVALEKHLKPFPSLVTLVRAVWMGDGGGLPKEIGPIYQWLGLLPVLALSGQHFTVLQRVLHWWLLPISWCLFYSQRLRGVALGLWIERGGAILTILIFWCMAWHLGSVQRTIAMAVAGFCLRCRHIHSRPIERASAAVLLFLLSEPTGLLDVGFMLSGTFAVLTLVDFGEGSSRRQKHFARVLFKWFSFSILSIGIQAFFFAKFSWVAPVSQFILGVVWEFFWIPVAFLIPVLSWILPDPIAIPFLKWINFVWEHFLSGQLVLFKDLAWLHQTVFCPTLFELLLGEGVLIIVILNARRYLFGLSDGKTIFVPR